MSDFSQENDAPASDAWYSYNGPENDVVLSTRIRLARNLASYPFPKRFKDDDAYRVRTLVFDSFAHCENPDQYTGVNTDELDELGSKILDERGVIELTSRNPGSGIIIRTDGKISCTVNDIDHVRIASFVPGLNAEKAFSLCQSVDDQLQNTIQFAANYEMGFLNSAVADTGSGMKVSCRLHLPSLSFSGRLREILVSLNDKGVVVRDCFGSGEMAGSSLGFYYQISTKCSGNGNELDQMAGLISCVKLLVENERREREFVLRKRQTQVRDKIYRSYARVKFAQLISLRESVEIISDIKWGKNLGFFSDISDTELCSLLYRSQSGHLQFLLKNRNLNFPVDISENSQLKSEYLRASLLQEAFENIKVN